MAKFSALDTPSCNLRDCCCSEVTNKAYFVQMKRSRSDPFPELNSILDCILSMLQEVILAESVFKKRRNCCLVLEIIRPCCLALLNLSNARSSAARNLFGPQNPGLDNRHHICQLAAMISRRIMF